MIVAAEASSALYAQRLLELWQQEGKTINAFGIGSRSMEAIGFEIVGRSEELAVVGFQEVLAHYSDIKKTFNHLLELAQKRRPKVALLLDYPDFNLRLADKLKQMGIPVVYYISPQVWAWRTSRIHKIKSVVDKMLVLFPFEKEFYDKYSVPVEFVGHPLLDELEDKYFDKRHLDEQRSKYGIKEGEILLALMPGSRRSELKHHLPTQFEVAGRIHKKNPNVKIALLVAPTFSKEEFQSLMPNYQFPLMLIKDNPLAMISLADVILSASGTATLLVGLLEKPLVIMYKMNFITAYIAKKFVKSTKYFGMINLVLNKMVAPEFFQEKANPDILQSELEKFIESPQLRQSKAKELSVAKKLLGERGATKRVALALEEFLES